MRHQVFDRMKRAGFLGLMLIIGACGGGGTTELPAPPPPTDFVYSKPADNGDTWVTAHADNVGFDASDLVSMMNAIRDGGFEYIDSIAIARSGSLFFDETIRTTVDAEDRRVNNIDISMHAQFSATKSITALAVGVAIDEGYIAGVDTPYLSLFPYPAYANWDDRKNDITVGHVLAMHAGFEWNEWSPPYSSPENQLIRFYEEEVDYTKALLDLPMTADPGAQFAYNTAATISLAQAIENQAPLTFVDFGAAELMAPLGISEVEFLTTPTGLPNTGGGFYFRTRDMVKFGQVMLDAGTWNGERIVSSAWIDELVTPRTAMTWPNPDDWDWQLEGYGYQWWLGRYESSGQQLQSWVMWGFGGQWVVVIPERQLVIAINSHGYDNSDAALNQAHTLIRNYLLPASE